MACQKKVLLAGLSFMSVLVVCFLYRNLDRPLSWSIEPLRRFHGFMLDMSSPSGEAAGTQWSPVHPASTPTSTSTSTPAPHTPRLAHRPGSTARAPKAQTSTVAQAGRHVLAEPEPTSRSAGRNSTRRAPTPRPPRAPGITDPPFIGDSYKTKELPALTACRDGIGSHVTKTDFAGTYVRGIPVLQWAEDVSLEQHQRLSRYPGAHGWGGVDYTTLAATLSVLNSSANQRMLDDWEDRRNTSECIRCAVVGNGGILKDSKKGKEIDTHHYVFRTNGAVIEGFEQDVGSRTTHYTFSTNTLMNSMNSYAGLGYRGPPLSQETRYVFLPDHDRDYLLVKAAATHTLVERGPERGKDPSKYFGADVSAKKLKMYHPDFIRYLRNRFLRSSALKTRYKDIYRPSTGAVMLLAALHTCDEVSAYGFMTPDYKNYSNHYYDRDYHPVGFFINHDLRMEMALWQRLHQAGLMQLYMRS